MGLIINALSSAGAWLVIISEFVIVFTVARTNKKILKYVLVLAVIYLAWVAYHFEPTPGNDLLYHFKMIELAKSVNWSGLVAHYQFASNPGLYVIYLVVSKLPSAHWLSVVVVLVVYGIVFFIIYDCQNVFPAFDKDGNELYSIAIAITYVVYLYNKWCKK